MERLTTLRAEMTPDWGTVPADPAANYALDWDLPLISSIHCFCIPLLPVLSPDATPIIKFQSTSPSDIHIPLQAMPYQLFVELNLLASYRSQIYIDERAAADSTLPFTHLTELKINLGSNSGGDIRSIHHSRNFNRLRFPKLRSFGLRFDNGAASPVASFQDALASMKHLLSLEISNCTIPFEDFVDEALFPRLLECTISHTLVTKQTFSRVRRPGFPLTRFPPSFQKLCFVNSLNKHLPRVVSQLVQSLHHRFMSDYGRGMVKLLCWDSRMAALLDELENTISERVGEDVGRRLEVIRNYDG